jgi:lysophospholipase L1-like esterase
LPLRFAKALIISVAGFAVITLATSGIAFTEPAGASTSPDAFYLDIGASESLGFQPTPAVAFGQRTDSGYADYLVALEAAKGIALQLDEIGCPGETTATMIDGADACHRSGGSQLADAEAFLSGHQDQSGLVTVDLGFNDIKPCIRFPMVDHACVEEKIEIINEQLPAILSQLKAVAGSDVTFVGLGHYDPYLADALNGTAGLQFANESRKVIYQLDHALRQIYGAQGIPVADVGDAFDINDTDPVTLAGIGVVPDDVAETCLLTWMCQSTPYGPNIHPNDAGYEAIANAIAAVLPAPW